MNVGSATMKVTPRICAKKELSVLATCGMVYGELMSEFKFACPVCGQHITTDSRTSGGQLECPTCFQKIIVPQAPTSADSKLILSASQVGKPRPIASGTTPEGESLKPTSKPLLIPIAAGGLFLGMACAAAFIFRDKIFKSAAKPD